MSTAPPPRLTRNRPFIRYVLMLLVGMYPFAMAFGVFAGIEPLDWRGLARALTASWSITFLLYGVARVFIRNADARALWLATILIGFAIYGLALTTLGAIGVHLNAAHPLLALGYVLIWITFATLVVRPWRGARLDLVPLLLLAAIVVGMNVYLSAAHLWTNREQRWRGPSDEIAGAVRRTTPATHTPERDIFYIVLDDLGRADTLRDLYHLDGDEFLGFLRERGFYVPERARSNYGQTLLSFASFLNLGYLDSLSLAVGRDSASMLSLAELIQRNALMRLAKDAGYGVTAIGSDYSPTRRFRQADVCHCGQPGLYLFEQAVIDRTPLVALPLDRWTYGAHREKILDAFSTLEQEALTPSPRLVLAHILIPHPPFTFAQDGAFQRPNRIFMFNEGSDFPGPREEYVRGYHDQAAFAIRRLREVIDTILRRPGPRPVIIVHGDHGPASLLQQGNVAPANLAERMNVFAAYYFPDVPSRFYPSMTLVNGARALANAYLGTDLPFLPDRSSFSTGRRPFDFTTVPPETDDIQ